jgi:hypothetical protein
VRVHLARRAKENSVDFLEGGATAITYDLRF